MDWKKRWENELDSASGQMSERVKHTPIYAVSQTKKSKFPLKLISLVSGALATVLVLCIALAHLLTPLPPVQKETFTVSINPMVAVTVENGKVAYLTSLNTDADVLITALDGKWKNATPSEVVKMIADYAVKLGYIDVDEQCKIELKGEQSEVLQTATKTMQSYFKEKGVYCAVYMQSIEKEAISQIAGIDLTLKENLGKLVYQRQENSQQNYQQAYENFVLSCDFIEVLKEGVAQEIELAYQKAELVSSIKSLNDEIENHADNDAIFVKDYWTITKRKPIQEFSPELGELLEQMSELLEQTEKETGIVISDHLSLIRAESVYNQENIDITADTLKNIIQVLENVSADINQTLISVLSNIEANLQYLANLPSTIEEYLEDCNEFVQSKIELLKAKYEENANKDRQPISDEEYDRFLQDFNKN